MKKILLLLLLGGVCLGFAQSNNPDQEFVTDEIIVKFTSEASKNINFSKLEKNNYLTGIEAFDNLNSEYPIKSIKQLFNNQNSNKREKSKIGLDRYVIIKYDQGTNIQEILEKYKLLESIEVAELNHIAKSHVVPDDPLYGEQWGLNNTGNAKEYDNESNLVGTPGADLNLEAAWDIHTGSDNVTIAIIDEGVDYNHPEFTGRIVDGYDYVDDDNDPFDSGGHGTSCAGIAAASGNNGIGVAGVNWGAKIMPIRALGDNGGTYADIASSIIFAVDNGANVISMSLGGSASDSTLEDAVEYAYNNDILVFASRGNDDNTDDNYPSSYTTVISVGGLSPCDTRKTPTSCDGEDWWGASYGGGQDKMDFVAPAARITTTDITGTAGYDDTEYTDSFNGTSSACPYAAGVGALIRSYAPDLTVDEIREIMRVTSVDIGATGYDDETGFGRLDAEKALLYAGCSLSAPNNLSSSNITDNGFQLSWSAVSGADSYTITIDENTYNTTGTSYTISDLNPGLEYNCDVAANCEDGGLGDTSSISVETTGDPVINCSTTITTFPYTESFETDEYWTQSTDDDGDWTRRTGSTPSNGTGPSGAADGSYYLYTEASTSGLGSNATVIVTSPCLDLTSSSEADFTFQNHMNGTSIGSLKLEITVNDIDWTEVWSLSGSQGNQWNSVTVNLDDYAGSSIKLRFTATTGSSWSSDISIDDLNLNIIETSVDNEAPSTPNNVSSSNITDTSFDISWDASTDNVAVSGYEVFLDNTSQGTTTDLSYAFSNLSPNTSYNVTVLAFDEAGNESDQSDDYSVTTSKSEQSITFNALEDKLTSDDDFDVSASASSGLDVAFSIVSGPASISGNTISLDGSTGTVVVRASQAGDNTYEAANDVDQQFEVTEPTTPTVEAFQQSDNANGLVVMEAENYDTNTAQGSHQFELTNLSGYSGTGAMTTTPNNGTLNNTNYENNSPRLDYKVNFKKTGTHYIWLRMNAQGSGTDDSFHAGLDGSGPSTSDRITSNGNNGWTWVRGTMDNTNANLEVNSTGIHEFNIWMREDGSNIDKILLTVDASYTPDNNEDESPRGETEDLLSQTITFNALDDKLITDDAFDVSASASSGLEVSFSIVSGPASITGNTITLDGSTGTVVVRASQAGDDTYEAADDVDQQFEVTDPDSETEEAFQQSDDDIGLVVMEAENYDTNTAQGSHQFELINLSGYSGTGAMTTTPNNGTLNNTNYESNSPRLDYKVNFKKTGTHYIWLRMNAQGSGTDDSFHAGLDGSGPSTSDRISSNSNNSWSWVRGTMDGTNANLEVNSTGIHEFNIWMREDGSNIDKILLTIDASYTPDNNEDESPRSASAQIASLSNLTNPDNNTSLISFEKVSIHPNPVKDILNIKTNFENFDIELINISGQIIYKGTEQKIDMTTLNKGLYYVKITVKNNSKIFKVIKI